MRARPFVLLFALLALVPGSARAQDFGVMESAETIDRGNFKLKVNPLVHFGKGNSDKTVGVAVMAGYGFTDKFDLEGGLAFYDGVTFFGANAEVWIVKRQPIDFSISGGLHFRRGDRTLNTTGVDLTFLASKHVGGRLELYGGLDFAFESISGGSFKTVHVVPGIEYKLGEDLDFLAELGLAVNNDARHYFSAGLAYYFR